MKEIFGDIWYKADLIGIPTNGDINRFGKAIMEKRGVGKHAVEKIPGIEDRIASAIKFQGNHLYMMGHYFTFPVKHHWRERADITLIIRSAKELSSVAKQYSKLIFVLPRLDCDNGQLKWEDVEPLLAPILPDNVHVITNRE